MLVRFGCLKYFFYISNVLSFLSVPIWPGRDCVLILMFDQNNPNASVQGTTTALTQLVQKFFTTAHVILHILKAGTQHQTCWKINHNRNKIIKTSVRPTIWFINKYECNYFIITIIIVFEVSLNLIRNYFLIPTVKNFFLF